MERDAQSLERDDLLETLAKHRGFLIQTARGLTDEQAASRPTASELCVGGLIKHVTRVEENWIDFIERGAQRSGPPTEAEMEGHAATFRVGEGETLAALINQYEAAARRTEATVRGLASLDAARPLPEAPWFEPGASWSARRVVLHILAETAQHAGHADIIRESLDGAKTMG